MKVFAEAILTVGNNKLPGNVAKVAAQHGLEALSPEGVREARAVAARLIGEDIASAERLVGLQSHFGAAVFGFRQDGALTGLLSAFPLNADGLAAVECAGFDAVELDLSLVARPAERPAAYYGWGFAATNKDGARAVLRACVDIHRLLYSAVPTYARAVTNDGARALQGIGFQPHASQSGLFYIAPTLALVRT